MQSAARWSVFGLVVTLLSVSSCGGGSGSTMPPPAMYSIGGTVSGLSGSGLVLQNNGGNDVPVSANGNFAFTSIASGSSYSVSVLVQPSGPPQTCSVTNGSGTAIGNVRNVQVVCIGEWAWMGGPSVNFPISKGVYGTQGSPAPDNIPGGRAGAVSWTDVAGNFWLFGGIGIDSTGAFGSLNDLWEYRAGEWTWMSGSNLINQQGAYGTEGTGALGNSPGARYFAVGWTDGAGNLWLFGGMGLDSIDRTGDLNDLWKYGGGEWTWMSGSNLTGQFGTYGDLGVSNSSSIPGARQNAVSWADATGTLWLFGGFGSSLVDSGDLNDLWKYSAGEWTWMSGSNQSGQQGTYGLQGTPDPSNVPGARTFSVGWTDLAGNLWLFGGSGFYFSGGRLDTYDQNDLWRYSGGEWTWMSGSSGIMVSQAGTYGTQGLAAPDNVPGSRHGSVTWTDGSGDLWLFGGEGYDSSLLGDGAYYLNDLWKYSGGQWTWVSGPNIAQVGGTYGTQGVPDPKNVPGGRYSASSWIDANGSLWLFGGNGIGDINDLWRFEP